jgi:hypothetical protein
VQLPSNITPDQARAIGDALAEQGRTLATLNDWRAILFVAFLIMVVLTVLMVVIIIVLLQANRQERRDMVSERERMWGVADKFGDAAGKLTGELQVLQVLNARVESALGRCDDLLQENQRRGKRP